MRNIFGQSLACLCVVWAGMAPVGAVEIGAEQKPAAAPSKPAEPAAKITDGELLQKVLDRVSALERELQDLRLKTGKLATDKKDQRIVALLESPYLGSVY